MNSVTASLRIEPYPHGLPARYNVLKTYGQVLAHAPVKSKQVKIRSASPVGLRLVSIVASSRFLRCLGVVGLRRSGSVSVPIPVTVVTITVTVAVDVHIV